MNLTEACKLSELIHSDDRFIVIAIGRFLLLDELTQPGAIERPWGLTVMPRDMPTRRVTLWSPEQWTEYRDLVAEELAPKPEASKSKPVRRPTQAAPAAEITRVPVTPTEDQLLLF